ncbi:MAG: PIN domain-containing protein [Armatimonadetes bacterium]|nr:PIN domain-containing protein [Armatimonadota bacterium]
MTLTDACTLVALVNKKDAHHDLCRNALQKVNLPLLTTWVCFAEAMHLALGNGGWLMQEQLWQYSLRGIVRIYAPSMEEERRMYALMRKYRDRPMDLGDASLVVAAEVLNLQRIFTIDSDFYFYTLFDKSHFEVFPQIRP